MRKVRFNFTMRSSGEEHLKHYQTRGGRATSDRVRLGWLVGSVVENWNTGEESTTVAVLPEHFYNT